MVQRARDRDNPPNVDLEHLVIDGVWAQTVSENPDQFLIHDNRDNTNRCVVFSSPQCLDVLSRTQEWFTDGNFSMAPPHFQQVMNP